MIWVVPSHFLQLKTWKKKKKEKKGIGRFLIYGSSSYDDSAQWIRVYT